jgi:hypothetical protein
VGGIVLHIRKLMPAHEAARPVAGAVFAPRHELQGRDRVGVSGSGMVGAGGGSRGLGPPAGTCLLVGHGFETCRVGAFGAAVIRNIGLCAHARARHDQHLSAALQEVDQLLQLLVADRGSGRGGGWHAGRSWLLGLVAGGGGSAALRGWRRTQHQAAVRADALLLGEAGWRQARAAGTPDLAWNAEG